MKKELYNPEIALVKEYGNPKISVHNRVVLGLKAETVRHMVDRWGMVAAREDGEDSTGRSRITLLSPGELVERACHTTELMFDEFESRGWLTIAPTTKEIKTFGEVW